MVVLVASFLASVTIANQQPELPSLAERAARQQQTYWRVRTVKTLERLEKEARRMLQLEEELGAFAMQYYDAVGDAVERLATIEEQLAEGAGHATGVSPAELDAVLAQRDAREARRAELKTRYRNLAKEIHPDRAMVVQGAGAKASHMHTLNASYQKGDLAGLLKLEAEMILDEISDEQFAGNGDLERGLREIERAADTYAAGYRSLLHSPINELMLRAMQARLAGWDWMDAVVRRVERAIEEKERALVMANIAAIGQWREGCAA